MTRTVGRRRLLGGALVAATVPLTGCEEVLPAPPGAGTPAGRSAPDPDEALVTRALRAEEAVLAGLTSLVRTQGGSRLAQALRPTLAVHLRHRELLGGEGPVPRGRPLTTGRLTAAEQRLARTHTELCLRAASGPFARLLASMAAACAQQADLWRDPAWWGPGGGDGR